MGDHLEKLNGWLKSSSDAYYDYQDKVEKISNRKEAVRLEELIVQRIEALQALMDAYSSIAENNRMAGNKLDSLSAYRFGRQNAMSASRKAKEQYRISMDGYEKTKALKRKFEELLNIRSQNEKAVRKDKSDLVSTGAISGKFADIIRSEDYCEKPRVVDRATFDLCVKQSGLICFRTFSDSPDGVSARTFKERLSTDSAGTFKHNGTGYKAFGDGIYVTANGSPEKGRMPGAAELNAAKTHSLLYGTPGARATACITVDADMNLASGEEVWNEFKKLPPGERMKYITEDYTNTKKGLSGYAVAKGYDGLVWKNAGRNQDGSSCDYITIYNRKKLIVLDDPANTAFGIH